MNIRVAHNNRASVAANQQAKSHWNHIQLVYVRLKNEDNGCNQIPNKSNRILRRINDREFFIHDNR